MASRPNGHTGLDLTQGVSIEALEEGQIVQGHVDGEAVILARFGSNVFAVGAKCTHYGGPLGKGMVTGETIRCPWHHACFSLRTGEAVGAPAFDPIERWNTEQRGNRVFVTGKASPERNSTAAVNRNVKTEPKRIVIVGGGAAGFSAAEMLRRRNFGGELTMLSSDDDAPYDRPNLSKDYLAGSAPEDWIPLRPSKFYEKKKIDLQLGTTANRIDTGARAVIAGDGRSYPFDRLLLATGAEPVRLSIPGASLPHVFVLRTLADSRAIIERAKNARSAVVIGAGFIGLEVASALRARGTDVHVVAPDALPLQKVLGSELGEFIRSLHERHGVRFHLENTVVRIEEDAVILQNGEALDCDLVIVGIGVKPRTALAKETGIKVAKGILVDGFLETSVSGIFAAGDVAEWPDNLTGEPRRVEHWVVAERQGQVAAHNMLGGRQRFSDAPFFWSAHYDTTIRYVGHSARWDAVEIDGDIAVGDGAIRYKSNGRAVAVATIGRDREALEAGVAMEHEEVRG